MSSGARVAAGLGWTGGVHWLGVVASTATTAVLARLLVPADLAVVVAAGAVSGLVGILQESGLAAAVVQHTGDRDRAATTALVLNLAASTVALAACVAASPWLAAFFQIDRPAALAAAFAPLWLRAWYNVPLARLQRSLAFGRCALVEGAQVLVYPAVTIPLAWAGRGPWSLVLGQAAAATAGALAAWVLVGWRPRRCDFDWAVGRDLARYGRPLVGANLLGTMNDRIDDWVVGRCFGPAALGVYAMAFRLSTLPRTGFSFVASHVLFPTLAGLQADPRRFRETYLRGLHWVAVLALPASAGLALVAPDHVGLMLGPRWTAAVVPLRILSGFALLASLSATTGDVFKAAGRSRLILRIGFLHSAILWTGLALIGRHAVAYVALSVTLAALGSGTAAFGFALAVLGLRPAACWRALRGPVVASAVMAGGVLAAQHAVAGTAGLVAAVVVGGLVYVATLLLTDPDDVHQLGAVVRALGARRAVSLPARAASAAVAREAPGAPPE